MASASANATATPSRQRLQPQNAQLSTYSSYTSLVSIATVANQAVQKLHRYLLGADISGHTDKNDAAEVNASDLPSIGVMSSSQLVISIPVDPHLDAFVQSIFDECNVPRPGKGARQSEQSWSDVFDQLYIRKPGEDWSPLSEVWDAKLLDFLPRIWINIIERKGELKFASDTEVKSIVQELVSSGQQLPSVVYRVVPVKKRVPVDSHAPVKADKERPKDGGDVTVSEYIRALQTHVSSGSKPGASLRHKYFISTTADFGTALWYSCVGALPVIRIDIRSGGVIAIPVGDGADGLFRSAMARSYALSSSEVVIDSLIPPNAYGRVKFHADAPLQRFDLYTSNRSPSSLSSEHSSHALKLPNFDPAKISSAEELRGLTRPVKVEMKDENGNVVRVVVKLGAKDGDGDGVSSSNHRQNARHLLDEFFARIVYDAAGALVPSCSLQLIPIRALDENGKPFPEAATSGTQLVWVLLSEFISSEVNENPMDNDRILSALASNVMVDLVLHNLDAMGNKFSNVITISDEIRRSTAQQQAYRVDTGACWGNRAARSSSNPRLQEPAEFLRELQKEMHGSKASSPFACLSKVLAKVTESDRKAAVVRLQQTLSKQSLLNRIVACRYNDTRFFELCNLLQERLLAWRKYYGIQSPRQLPATVSEVANVSLFPLPRLPEQLHVSASRRDITSSQSSEAEIRLPEPTVNRKRQAASAPETDVVAPTKRAGRRVDSTAAAAHEPIAPLARSVGSSSSADTPNHESQLAGTALSSSHRHPSRRRSRGAPARDEDEPIWIVGPQQSKNIDGLLPQDRTFINMTSKSTDREFQCFSPFFAHGNIEVPFIPEECSESVEGVWQGLKVFEHEGVDRNKFKIKTMKNIKRAKSAKRGDIKGHFAGQHLLDYEQARKQIYIPTYHKVLANQLRGKVAALLDRLRGGEKFIFQDYYVNGDIDDTSRPLSHASLLKEYLMQHMSPDDD